MRVLCKTVGGYLKALLRIKEESEVSAKKMSNIQKVFFYID